MTNWERKKINHGFIWTWKAGLGFLVSKAKDGWDISEGGEYIATTRYPETAKELCRQMVASRDLLALAKRQYHQDYHTGIKKSDRMALLADWETAIESAEGAKE